MTLHYTLVVTGPAYGTQQASCAYQFALALLDKGHVLDSVFFYREGVTNANQFTLPATDEFDLVAAWQRLAQQYNVVLNVCVSAALRRGIIDKQESERNSLNGFNLHSGFQLSGLGSLAEAMLSSDRVIQF